MSWGASHNSAASEELYGRARYLVPKERRVKFQWGRGRELFLANCQKWPLICIALLAWKSDETNFELLLRKSVSHYSGNMVNKVLRKKSSKKGEHFGQISDQEIFGQWSLGHGQYWPCTPPPLMILNLKRVKECLTIV